MTRVRVRSRAAREALMDDDEPRRRHPPVPPSCTVVPSSQSQSAPAPAQGSDQQSVPGSQSMQVRNMVRNPFAAVMSRRQEAQRKLREREKV
jgi:hypothetical protein